MQMTAFDLKGCTLMKDLRLRNLVILLLSLVMVTGCGSVMSGRNTGPGESGGPSYTKIDRGDEDTLYVIAATDLHYLAKSLNDEGEYMEKIALSGDGKAMHYIDHIVKAFIEQVISHQPDALILTGDLTYNGEAQSHIDLVKLLEQVEASGIPVGILPGNHDIDMPFSYGFKTGEAVPTDSVTYQEFQDLYGAFGYDEAELKDETSFSYMMELNDDIWAVFLDCNAEGSRGRVSTETLNWLISALEEARKQGKTVISASHQTLRIHNEMFTDGFLIENDEVIREIYDYYDVRLNLSGHLHIQHLTLDPEGLNETSTGSAAVQPNNLAHILIDRDLNVTYQTEPIDVAYWSKAHQIPNHDLRDFADYSLEFFIGINYQNTLRMFENRTDLTKKEIETMVEFSSRANAAYFGGDLCSTCEGLTEDEGYRLWCEKASDTFIFKYMDSYLHDPPTNYNLATFSIAPLAAD